MEPPPLEDEVPPDDGHPSGGRSRPPTRPVTASAPANPSSGTAPASNPVAPPPPPAPVQPAPPAVDLTTAEPPAPARVVTLADDEPSSDDADFEGSHLVGAQVVQQLLGGRVIEELEA
jgi:hypothetical protein